MSIYFRKSGQFPIVERCALPHEGEVHFAAGERRARAVRLRGAAGQPPRGGLVLLQEIFGVTAHIRRVCDGYAAHGYHIVAPALFDRIRPGIELGYSKDDAVIGRDLRGKIPWDQVFADRRCGKGAGRRRRQGRDAWLLLGRHDVVAHRHAARRHRRRRVLLRHADRPYVAEQPRCPVLMHFGERDPIATLEHAGACARRRARRSKSRSIRQATASTATRPPISTRRARPWRCGVRSIFCPPHVGWEHNA